MSEESHKRSKFKVFLLYVRSLSPFLIAHHPDCENLKDHTLKIGRIKLCIGCSIGYPAAILGIILIDVFNLTKLLTIKWFFLIGFLFLSFILLSVLNLTRNKTVKIIQKIIIGFGGSFLFWGLIQLPNPYIINVIIIFFVFSGILGILNFYHVFSIYKECKKCEHYLNWNICPGFERIRQSFEKYNIANIFEGFDKISERLKQKRDQKSKS